MSATQANNEKALVMQPEESFQSRYFREHQEEAVATYDRNIGAIFAGWAATVAGSLAYSMKKHSDLILSQRIIHARVYAQAATLGGLGLVAINHFVHADQHEKVEEIGNTNIALQALPKIDIGVIPQNEAERKALRSKFVVSEALKGGLIGLGVSGLMVVGASKAMPTYAKHFRSQHKAVMMCFGGLSGFGFRGEVAELNFARAYPTMDN